MVPAFGMVGGGMYPPADCVGGTAMLDGWVYCVLRRPPQRLLFRRPRPLPYDCCVYCCGAYDTGGGTYTGAAVGGGKGTGRMDAGAVAQGSNVTGGMVGGTAWARLAKVCCAAWSSTRSVAVSARAA